LDAAEGELSADALRSVVDGCDVEGVGGESGGTICVGDGIGDGDVAVEVGLRCVGPASGGAAADGARGNGEVVDGELSNG